MSFDRLQGLIKTTKCPIAAELFPAPKESAEEFLAFGMAFLEALRGTVPALRLSMGSCAGLGWQGMKALSELLARAGELGLFTILDAPLTAGAGAGELQELVAGDRLVYQVVGDLAQRLGKSDLGRLGYSRMGVTVEGVYPSDLRALRKRWEQSFLLTSGPAGDARFAFDQYGRGAVVSTTEPLLAARGAGGDPSAAGEKAAQLRTEWKQYITIL